MHYQWVTDDFLSGSATGGGTDYTDIAGFTVTFEANEVFSLCVVTITNDQLPETEETFTVYIANPGGGASLGTQTTATVTITDDFGE